MVKAKGIGGKKHRRGKNIQISNKVDIPDEEQYFGVVEKSLGCGRVNLNYFKSTKNTELKNDDESINWEKKEAIGVIRGKMMRRIFINVGDIILVTEREYDNKNWCRSSSYWIYFSIIF